MSVTLGPVGVFAEAALVPIADDFQLSPPEWWHTIANQWHHESGTAVTGGRHRKDTGELESVGTPKPQDTYKFGTASRTGLAFDTTSGTVKDDWIHPETGKYGLLFPDGTSGATAEVTEHTAGTSLSYRCIVLRKGIPAPGSTATSTNTRIEIELANGDANANYRIVIAYGEPFVLEYKQTAGGLGWRPIASSESLGSVETYLATHNGEARLTVRPDYSKGILSVEVGHGYFLRQSPDRPFNPASPNSVPVLPGSERYYIKAINSWASISIYPLRFKAVTIYKEAVSMDPALTNIVGGAVGLVGQLGTQDTTQTNTFTANQQTDAQGQNKVGWTLTSSRPDAGDGLGSTTPAQVSDVVLYNPAVWSTYTPIGNLGIPEVQLTVQEVIEHQVWDDANRVGRTFGTMILNNSRGQYSGTMGNYALNLQASNGFQWGQRLRGVMGSGIGEGIQIHRNDPSNFVIMPFCDFWEKMNRALTREIILDGLALSTAIRLVCSIGQISPRFMTNILDAGFPPYPDGFNGYILGKGMGMNPKYRFGPEHNVERVILELLQDSGEVDPYFGRSTPYFAYFDPYGNFNVRAYNPGYYSTAKSYSTNDPSGYGQIIDEPMVVSNSTEQLRTGIALMGQDAYTYQGLYWDKELPWNYGLVGWRKPWFERNSRYSSPAYMAQIAKTMTVQASLGTQIVKIKVPFDPSVFAGQLVSVSDDKVLRGTSLFTIMALENHYGYPNPAECQCYSWVTLRSLQNSLVY